MYKVPQDSGSDARFNDSRISKRILAGGVDNSYFACDDVVAGSIPALSASSSSSVVEHDTVVD